MTALPKAPIAPLTEVQSLRLLHCESDQSDETSWCEEFKAYVAAHPGFRLPIATEEQALAAQREQEAWEAAHPRSARTHPPCAEEVSQGGDTHKIKMSRGLGCAILDGSVALTPSHHWY